jgi:hypothetical protein
MKQGQMLKTGWYIFSYTIATVFTWIFITRTRKVLLNEEPQTYMGLFTQYGYFYQSILLVVLFWLALFAIAGAYNIDLFKKITSQRTNSHLPPMPYWFFVVTIYSFFK